MINKIGANLNFTSSILYNKTLDKGFNQAKIEARTGDTKTANQFANAVYYLKNDGKNDVYYIETRNAGYDSQSKVYLVKNGKVVNINDDTKRTGKNVMNAIVSHFRQDIPKEISKKKVKHSYPEVKNSINLINKHLENIRNQFSDDLEMLSEIDNIEQSLSKLDSEAIKKGMRKNQSELYVQKLDEILGDVHYGEML